MKLGTTATHKPPPLILAAESPSKVAPPSEAAVQSPGDSGSLLLKDFATPTPAKIVSNEEVPVDLTAISREVPAGAPSARTRAGASAVRERRRGDACRADRGHPSRGAVGKPRRRASGRARAVPRGKAREDRFGAPRRDAYLRRFRARRGARRKARRRPPRRQRPRPSLRPRRRWRQTPTLDVPEKPAAKSSARVTASKTPTTVLPPDDEFNPPQPEAPAAPQKPAKLPTKLRPPKTRRRGAGGREQRYAGRGRRGRRQLGGSARRAPLRVRGAGRYLPPEEQIRRQSRRRRRSPCTRPKSTARRSIACAPEA